GPVQGDAHFGDIRIAAVPMAPDVVAVATPFDLTAGTWSGDVRFNSEYVFGLGDTGHYDLFTMALHEAGHVFGLGHSTDPNSAMYEDFVQARTGLTQADTAALRALYGVRTPDASDAKSKSGNGTFATATPITFGARSTGAIDADITTLDDVDVYQFKPPANAEGVTVRLKTTGLSLL